MRGIGDFEGTWTLSRRIEDRLGRQAGRFEGRAVLAPGGDGLVYEEAGTLTLGAAAPMQATRRYLWRAEGGLIAVEFDDGRHFHAFDPNADRPEAHHDCAPDVYDVRYDFDNWPEWRAVWEVRGPRKDYRMESLYRRG